jgi:hypothetical protein
MSITFKNTPIVQEGSFYHPGKRELGKTRQLINKMVSGSAVLIANREDSGRVGLTIGGWQQMSGGGGGGGMWMGGAGPGMTMTAYRRPGKRFSGMRGRMCMRIMTGTITH